MASTTLRFNAAIYSKAALEATRDAYVEFARLDLQKEGPAWRLDVEPVSDEIPLEVLAHEIMNYALAETAHQKRGVSA